MDLNNSIIFGGIDSANYGIYVAGNAVFNSPERDVTMIDVPGRNGQLTFDNGRFMNIEVTYNAFVTGDNSDDIADNIRGYRNAIGSLIGYQRLEDTFHTDEYRQAIFRNGIEVEPTIYQTGGYFDITVDCKPQRWLTSGETEKTLQAVFTNPTLFDAKPLIRIKGHGDVTLLSSPSAYKSKITFAPNATVENAGYSRYYDCELFEAYYIDSGGVIHSCNSDITITFGTPAFWGNETIAISTDSGISDYGFTPRWWRI